MNQKIYLDNNGSTFLAPEIRELFNQEFLLNLSNPSSIHSFGRQSRVAVNRAKEVISTHLNVKPTELIFTSGGTENANMILRGVFAQPLNKHLITSTVEHSCVYATAKAIEKMGAEVTYLEPGLYGSVSPEAVKAAIRPNTQLIALMAVNNETGVKTDIEAISALAKQRNIHFFVDGVALLGKEPFVIHPGISAMSFSGHKIHAPQGIGVSFIRSGFKFDPLLTGGEQEYGKRAGSENILGILALGKAFELIFSDLNLVSKRMDTLRSQFEQMLLKEHSFITINGKGPRTVNVSNIAFTGIDGEGLLIALDRQGLAASHGSACSSGALEPSRVLTNMGIPLKDVRSSIRFSLSRYTTEEEIVRAVALISSTINKKYT